MTRYCIPDHSRSTSLIADLHSKGQGDSFADSETEQNPQHGNNKDILCSALVCISKKPPGYICSPLLEVVEANLVDPAFRKQLHP